MMRAVVIGGSLGGLTAALVLRDQGWDVDVLERSPNPLEGRGTGIVVHPTTVRYLVERAGITIGDIGLPAHRLQYLDTDGSIADEEPCAYRFASYFELYRGLLDAFGSERYHLSNELAQLDNRGDAATLSLTDGQTFAADLVVCADGIRSTGRRIMLPDAQPRYAGYVAWRGTIDIDELSGRTASTLLDAFTYRILPRGHLLSYPIPGPSGSYIPPEQRRASAVVRAIDAIANENATVEWIDGNLGSKVTMKYPSVYLMGEGAHAEVMSAAFAGSGQHQDAGSKAIHVAPNTTSNIVSRSISKGSGRTSYRGHIKVLPKAHNVKVSVRCDALLLDEESRSDTYPYMDIDNPDVTIGHEASVSKVGEDQIFYLTSRGIPEQDATALIVNGFFEPFVKELPMEYAVELNRLLALSMEGAIG